MYIKDCIDGVVILKIEIEIELKFSLYRGVVFLMNNIFEISDLVLKLSVEREFSIKKLNIARGKMIAVVGVSGSGKSTFAGLVSGLNRNLTDVAGTINLNLASEDYLNIDVFTFAGSSRMRSGSLGYMFQHNDLIKTSPATTNISMSANFAGRDISSENMIDNMQMLGLTPSTILSDSGILSGGELQRVAFLRAFLRDPELIIADEPTASLDVNASHVLLETMSVWCKSREQNSVLWITHKLEEVYQWADGVIVFKDTKCLNTGFVAKTPENISTLQAWMSGEMLDQMEELDVSRNDLISIKDENYSSVEKLNTAPLQKSSDFFTRYKVLLSLVFNYIFSNGLNSRFHFSPLFHSARNLLSRNINRKYLSINRKLNHDSGELPSNRSFLLDLWRAFDQKSIVIGLMLFFVAFFVLYQFEVSLQVRTEEAVNEPSLSNIILRGHPNDFPLTEDNIHKLSCFLKGINSVDCIHAGANETARLYGRWVSPSKIVRPIELAPLIDEYGFIKDELASDQLDPDETLMDWVCRTHGREHEEIDGNVVAVRNDEPGLSKLHYVEPPTDTRILPFFENIVGNEGDVWKHGLIHRVILTDLFLKQIQLKSANKKTVPKYLCIQFQNWQVIEIAGVVKTLDLDVSHRHDILVTTELFIDAHKNEFNYEKAALYVAPDELNDMMKAVTLAQKNFHGITLERGFLKISKAVDNSDFYRNFFKYSTWCIFALLSFSIFQYCRNILYSNQRAFLVSRAYGMKRSDLLFFMGALISGLCAIAIVCMAAILFGLYIAILGLDELNTVMAVPYIDLFQKIGELVGDIDLHAKAARSLYLWIWISVFVATFVWWKNNDDIWKRMQELA